MFNGPAVWTFNRHQPKSCISLLNPRQLAALISEPLVLLLLFCLLTHKQTPGDWPTVRQCLFTLETRVHTSELRHMEPRARAQGKRKPGPGGAAGAWGGASGVGGFMIKTATARVRWEKAEEQSSVSSLSSMNPSSQESKVTAYMDTADRAPSQSISQTTSRSQFACACQCFYFFNQIFNVFFREKAESIWLRSMCLLQQST